MTRTATDTAWQSTATSYAAVRLDACTPDGGNGRPDIYRLTLNRPDSLNALNKDMFEEIPKAVRQAEQEGARVLIITGAGRGFCAGADLVTRVFEPGAPMKQQQDGARQTFERVINLVTAINSAAMPVICSINGVAAGGGVGIALAGDIQLMARSTRFVLTFVPKLGLVPDVSATWFMARSAGRARTLGASLTGDSISAEVAERWGLVYRSIDDGELEAETLAVARRLADGPQAAVKATRQLVDAATATALGPHLELERDAQCQLIGAPDHVEGVRAFREKRPGNYRAR